MERIVEELKTAKIIGSTRLIRRCLALYEIMERRYPGSLPHRIIENILQQDLKPFVENFNDIDDFDAEDYAVHQMLVDVGYLDDGAETPSGDCVCRTWVSDVPLTEGKHHIDCVHSQPDKGFTLEPV